MPVNPINDFYDFLKKRKRPEDKLRVIGCLYKNRGLEKGYVLENEELYKCLKLLVAFMNKNSDQYYVFSKKKNCKLLFDVYRKKFMELSNHQYKRIDTVLDRLDDCNDFLVDWAELYNNTAVLSFPDKNNIKAGIFKGRFSDYLENVMFIQSNIDTAYDEIQVYLEMSKNE